MLVAATTTPKDVAAKYLQILQKQHTVENHSFCNINK